MSNGTRQDTYSVSATIDGTDTGIWDKMSGGGVDSEERKYKPGGMAPEISLGGSSTTENVTLSRLYDLDRDHAGLVRTLLARVGRAKVTIHKQPLDTDGIPYGSPLVYEGVLKTVKPPEVDSEGSEAGMLEIEVSVAGSIG